MILARAAGALEFRAHLRANRDFFGLGIGMGDGNAHAGIEGRGVDPGLGPGNGKWQHFGHGPRRMARGRGARQRVRQSRAERRVPFGGHGPEQPGWQS